MITNSKDIVLFCSQSVEGRIHDKSLLDRLPFTKPIIAMLDLAFYGYKNPYVTALLPYKKSKYNPLTEEQIAQNKVFNANRVKIEHTIGRIKVLRILKEKMRNYKKSFKHLVMKIGVQLYNFKLINFLSLCS